MATQKWCIGLAFGLVLLNLSFAPAATDDPPSLEALAEARCQAAREFFDEAWLLYKRKGETPIGVYMTSSRLLQSDLERTEDVSERIAAYQRHLDRIEKMRAVVTKIRSLGYANKFEIKGVEYFVREAQFWLTREKSR